MITIVWTAAFDVGVERIDREHRTLVDMLNEMSAAISSGQGDAAVADIVAKMKRYAEQHFRTEEEVMKTTRYRDRDRNAHMLEHDAFIERMLDMERQLSRGGLVPATHVWDFLWDWLGEHIQGSDRRLGAHVRAYRSARRGRNKS